MSNGNPINFCVLGGGGEIGASCFEVSCNGHSILLDSGTHPKKEGLESLPAFSLLSRAPDAALISHAHVDHCGSLPYLLRQFPGVRSFATVPTVRLVDRMLHNSVSVMNTLRKERGIEEYPLYEHEDVSYAMRLMRGQGYQEWFDLPTRGIETKACFNHAGHVLGSASVLLKFPGHTLFYTSDICETDQELMSRYCPLDRSVEIDTLVIESTHGAVDDEHARVYEAEIPKLADAVAGVLRGGGVALIPCFALGRTQEITNIIARHQEAGLIPRAPIYASGLGRAIYEIYEKFPEYLSPNAELRPLNDFKRIGNVWNHETMEKLLHEPGIIVATSGMMLENTPSALIAEALTRANHHGIFFVGYLDHETLGYKLLHSQIGDKLRYGLGRQPVERKLENIKRFHFSAHAPRKALQQVIHHIRPKNVVFVHGDAEAIRWMQDNAANGCANFAPTIGQTITLEA
ncbi:MAG: MBL fold metallo-hydrolase [Candidatus Hydrogenedens sp.]|nr:MBL fold metallo-hydrolase [Candidatus Hydrogenedens sp.]